MTFRGVEGVSAAAATAAAAAAIAAISKASVKEETRHNFARLYIRVCSCAPSGVYVCLIILIIVIIVDSVS